MPYIFLIALTVLLIGYAFWGRSFAYLGYAPIYVGEIIFILGITILLFNREWLYLRRLNVFKWLILFMLWGALRTIPFLSVYGTNALRDGAIWGYSLYAIFVGYSMAKEFVYAGTLNVYSRCIKYFVIWVPVTILLPMLAANELPILPWGPSGSLPLFSLKGGDIAVHLSGILAFIILIAPYESRKLKEGAIMACWFVSFLLVGFIGRAALLTMSTVSAFLVFTSSPKRWFKWFSMVCIVVSLSILFNLKINTGSEREISFEQLSTNVQSIFGTAENYSGEGSKEWRLLWWSRIIEYTVFGEYFWTGKGYGINLADDDGFQVLDDSALRSPHNGHLTFLARGGVPGFVLWVSLQASFLISLFKTFQRWRKGGFDAESKICLWVLAYWLAFMVNGAFDVFLEGPQGGIWFWSLFGFGISLIYAERQIASSQAE